MSILLENRGLEKEVRLPMFRLRKLARLGGFLLAVFALLSVITGSQEAAYAAPKSESKVEMQSSALVNINKATSEELQRIRGIGPVIAERIIKYRQDRGRFDRVDDLTQVSGIGAAKLEKIKNQVTV